MFLTTNFCFSFAQCPFNKWTSYNHIRCKRKKTKRAISRDLAFAVTCL